jgi:hypothetical protein
MAKLGKRTQPDKAQLPPDVLQALRDTFGGLPREALQRIPPDILTPLVDGIAAITVRRRTHPNTVGLLVNPDPVPVTLEMKKFLKWKKNAERGRAVPHTMEFLDDNGLGNGRETVEIPIRLDRSTAAHSKRPPGAPRKLTLAQLVDHIRRHPSDLSDAARARMLSAEMGTPTPISRTVVLKLRHELERRRKRRKGSGAK